MSDNMFDGDIFSLDEEYKILLPGPIVQSIIYSVPNNRAVCDRFFSNKDTERNSVGPDSSVSRIIEYKLIFKDPYNNSLSQLR